MNLNLGKVVNAVLNKETISYIIAGIMTTAVDYLVFALVNETTKTGNGLMLPLFSPAAWANIISWAAAVVFAFIVNKIFVFRSAGGKTVEVLKEFGVFVFARVFSGAVSTVMLSLMADAFGINTYISKITTSVFNMIFNYVAGKWFVFQKKLKCTTHTHRDI